MKKIAMLMSAAMVVSSLMVPVSAKTKSLYVLTRFYCESDEKESTHDVRFSYNKKGLVTKQVDHVMDQPGSTGIEVDQDTYKYTYKGTKLIKKDADNEYTPGITKYAYSSNKMTAKSGYEDFQSTDTLTLKKNRLVKVVVKATEDLYNYTDSYQYNKKGQLTKVIDDGTSIRDRFKYDKKGYATMLYYGDQDYYQYKITYKNGLPSVIKAVDNGNKHCTYNFYYKKMKVSAVSAVTDQPYSFLHVKDPKSEQIYDFRWANS